MTEAYLGSANGNSVDNPTMQDVRNAILETINMDDEHGAFWVSNGYDEETVLETHKDLSIIGIFPGPSEQQIKSKLQSWNEVEELYEVFLSGDFDQVKASLIANS
jgi:hypothetical protein